MVELIAASRALVHAARELEVGAPRFRHDSEFVRAETPKQGERLRTELAETGKQELYSRFKRTFRCSRFSPSELGAG